MINKSKDILKWMVHVTLISLSIVLNILIVIFYAMLIYPCQLLLVRINSKRYTQSETRTYVKDCEDTKKVIKINGTNIYKIIYNKRSERDN